MNDNENLEEGKMMFNSESGEESKNELKEDLTNTVTVQEQGESDNAQIERRIKELSSKGYIYFDELLDLYEQFPDRNRDEITKLVRVELKRRERVFQEEERIGQIKEISGKLDDLKELFVNKLREDAHKNELFDKMYEELQRYKNNQQQKLAESVFKHIIFEIDQNQKLLDYYSQKEIEDLDPQKLFDLLKTIPESLETILASFGVEPLLEGGDFAPQKHQVIEAVDTKDKEMDKKIAEILKRGYEWDGKIIRKTNVKVYVYKEDKGEE